MMMMIIHHDHDDDDDDDVDDDNCKTKFVPYTNLDTAVFVMFQADVYENPM
jgi:hypothetical protein